MSDAGSSKVANPGVAGRDTAGSAFVINRSFRYGEYPAGACAGAAAGPGVGGASVTTRGGESIPRTCSTTPKGGSLHWVTSRTRPRSLSRHALWPTIRTHPIRLISISRPWGVSTRVDSPGQEVADSGALRTRLGDHFVNVEWRKISDWRNWRLPVKLGVVLLVPVAVAIGAGALQISGYVDRSNSYVQMQGLVRLRADLAPLISSVQQERTLAAQSATSGSGVGAYQNQISATDNASATVRRRFDRTAGLSDVARNRFTELSDQLGQLKNLREMVTTGGEDPTAVTTGYTGVAKSLLDFEQALVSQFGDPAISGTAVGLHNMVIAQEQVSQQHAIVLAGIGRGKLLGTEVRTLEQSDIRLQDRLNDFQAITTTNQRRAYEQTVTGAGGGEPRQARRTRAHPARRHPRPDAARPAEAEPGADARHRRRRVEQGVRHDRAPDGTGHPRTAGRARQHGRHPAGRHVQQGGRRRGDPAGDAHRRRDARLRHRPLPAALALRAAALRARRGAPPPARGRRRDPRRPQAGHHDRTGARAHQRGVRPAGARVRRGARAGRSGPPSSSRRCGRA